MVKYQQKEAKPRQRKNGCWEFQFRDENEERKTITLSSKYKGRIAGEFRNAIDRLVDAKSNRATLPNSTKVWIEEAPPDMRAKLVKFGLYDAPSEPTKHTTGSLWDTFLDEHSGMHEGTMKTYLDAKRRFFLFFIEPNELLETLTKERMEQWRKFLLTEGKGKDKGGYAEPTVAGTITKAKAVFNYAKSNKWITDSPLDGVKCGSYENEDNNHFVSQEDYQRLLNACPDQEWRVIIALCRVGGLHPNELVTLRWSDIDWQNGWITVYNAKVRQHKKWYRRMVPLFTELVPELKELLLQSDNEEYVVNRQVNRQSKYPTSNLVQRFGTIAKRAGIGDLPRPFDNMRASRSTEIIRNPDFGLKAESKWMGHSTKIALKHYLMITGDEHAIAIGKKSTKAVNEADPTLLPETMEVENSVFSVPFSHGLQEGQDRFYCQNYGRK
jgi:integrase